MRTGDDQKSRLFAGRQQLPAQLRRVLKLSPIRMEPGILFLSAEPDFELRSPFQTALTGLLQRLAILITLCLLLCGLTLLAMRSPDQGTVTCVLLYIIPGILLSLLMLRPGYAVISHLRTADYRSNWPLGLYFFPDWLVIRHEEHCHLVRKVDLQACTVVEESFSLTITDGQQEIVDELGDWKKWEINPVFIEGIVSAWQNSEVQKLLPIDARNRILFDTNQKSRLDWEDLDSALLPIELPAKSHRYIHRWIEFENGLAYSLMTALNDSLNPATVTIVNRSTGEKDSSSEFHELLVFMGKPTRAKKKHRKVFEKQYGALLWTQFDNPDFIEWVNHSVHSQWCHS
ncbi:MAG: hypothetical protein NXI24_10715 [bacterium]|nr:hypothetical protein [bacterium]